MAKINISKIIRVLFTAFISLFFLINVMQTGFADGQIAQQPTVAIPTVTGTPEGVTATVLLDRKIPSMYVQALAFSSINWAYYFPDRKFPL